MQVIQKITPCLWFDDQSEEAVEFYMASTMSLAETAASSSLFSKVGIRRLAASR